MTRFSHTVTVDGTDIAGIVLAGATITRGKRDYDDPPTPSTAYLELVTVDADPTVADELPEFNYGQGIPSGFRPDYRAAYEGGETRLIAGTEVTVGVSTPSGFRPEYVSAYADGYAGTRYTGNVTAIDYKLRTIALTLVDACEPLTRIMLVPTSWPVESETARVARIATAAGVTITVDGTSSTPITATPADATERSAWALLTDLTKSTGAILYADRDGVVRYRCRTATTGSVEVEVPPSSTIADELTLAQELGSIWNRVTVEYGEAVSGVRPTVTVDDDPSILLYGVRDRPTVVTVLDEEADALDLANRILDWQADLSWDMPTVAVNLRLAELDETLGVGQLQDLVELDVDDDVAIPDLPRGAPLLAYSSRVLGYVETLDRYAWQLDLALNPSGWTRKDPA